MAEQPSRKSRIAKWIVFLAVVMAASLAVSVKKVIPMKNHPAMPGITGLLVSFRFHVGSSAFYDASKRSASVQVHLDPQYWGHDYRVVVWAGRLNALDYSLRRPKRDK
jgi:hypothetical protein